jgi:heptosyltransferase III
LSPASSVRKVLIYRLGSLGDMVVALPCFHLIARAFPNAERVLLTNFPVHAKAPAAAAVLRSSDLIHGYIGYNAGTRKIGELARLTWRIRSFGPDVAVYLMPVRPTAQVERDRKFLKLASGARIVGIPGEEERKHAFDAKSGRYEPEASRLARAIRELGDAELDDKTNWSLNLTPEEKGAAAVALGPLMRKPLVVCGPGTKMQAKDWGQENWRSLLTWFHSRYSEFGLAFVGAQEDSDVCEYAARDWAGPRLNLCGKLTPRESAAVMAHARIFLGPDSGPMHLAASVGTPCVAAFSARAMPGTWFPYGPLHQVIYHQTSCYGCHLETCIAEARRCLTTITVQEMADAVCRVLDSDSRSTARLRIAGLGLPISTPRPAAQYRAIEEQALYGDGPDPE